jgi:spermidine dehydrogenase
MTKSDRELGMDRSITRRDFLNGMSVAVGGALVVPATADAESWFQRSPAPAPSSEYYPPALTGMRGSNPGSMDAAHAMRDGKTFDTAEDTRESYDLIVVGGGLSGLAAAYFFRKKATPNVKILVLDNHDDFGGHARRVEFSVNGRLLIAKGGTSYIERPATFTAEGRDLLKEIGIDFYDSRYKWDPNFYRSLGYQPATYFDKETFGEDRMVLGLTNPPTAEMLAKTPLSDQVRKDFIRLWTDKRDYLAGLSTDDKIQKLRKTSYRDSTGATRASTVSDSRRSRTLRKISTRTVRIRKSRRSSIFPKATAASRGCS